MSKVKRQRKKVAAIGLTGKQVSVNYSPGDKEQVDALLNALSAASAKALKEADDLNKPVIREIEGVLYHVYKNGRKKKFKKVGRRHTIKKNGK